MWAKLAAIYNRAKSANAAFSLADRAWQVFLLVTGLSGAGVLAWMSTTWHWYWATFSWAGVAIAFLISWVVLTGGFFLSAIAVRAWRNGKLSTRTDGNGDFMKNILIDASAPDAPALFSGTANVAFDRITLFLDYSAYFTGFGQDSWSDRRRVKLVSFDPFEKGIQYESAIFSRTLNTDGKTVALKWGNNADIITSDKYRARLAFTAPGKEQYFYFMLIAPYISSDGQRIVAILNQKDFTFRQEWEEA